MSTAVFPTLPGLGFDFTRSPMWSTNVVSSVSGKDTSIAYWANPKWKYELIFNVLRDTIEDGELAALRGFFNAIRGRFGTFLFNDTDDNEVTGQLIGTTDGVKNAFQLTRSLDGNLEPILAPNVVTGVYLDGTLVPDTDYSVSTWGESAPGVVTFNTTYSAGMAVTATFSYYFPCRFDDDTMELTKFLYKMWKAQSVQFTTVK